MLNTYNQATYLDSLNQEEEIIPFGTAKIAVIQGRWTFNNKDLKTCNVPVQQVVSNFIKGCAFALPFQIRKRKRSYSDLHTKETFYSSGHLKQYNHVFPPRPIDHKAVNEMEFVKVQ